MKNLFKRFKEEKCPNNKTKFIQSSKTKATEKLN